MRLAGFGRAAVRVLLRTVEGFGLPLHDCRGSDRGGGFVRGRWAPVVGSDLQSASMSMMKAVQVTVHGGPEVLAYQDVEKTSPGAGEALVKI